MHLCRECRVEKPLAEFSLTKYGLPMSYCRACNYARVKAWRKANPQKDKAGRARHRDAQREKRRADALARYHRLMAEGPDAVRARRRAQAKTEKGAIYNRLAAHKRRGVRYDAEAREYVAIILKDPCVYCGGQAVEVDHVTSITKGGSGHSSNLAPACRSCNARKNDDSLLVFMLRLRQAA